MSGFCSRKTIAVINLVRLAIGTERSAFFSYSTSPVAASRTTALRAHTTPPGGARRTRRCRRADVDLAAETLAEDAWTEDPDVAALASPTIMAGGAASVTR